MNRFLLTLSFIFSVLVISAQSYPPPSGVYCSCGPTFATGLGSVDPRIASQPFVKGILVRVTWDLLEPNDDQFNWVQLDTQILRANSYGKKVTLAVVNGPNAPRWLYSSGVPFASIGAPNNDTIPYPWDSTYLAEWDEMITALGNRYGSDTTITLVHITHATANGFEFFLNPINQFDWTTVGYTDSLIVDSWKKVINTFNSAFPNHYLDNDYHPIFLSSSTSSAPADSVYAYAKQAIGSRYGAFSSWWTQNNVATYPDQYDDLLESASTTFATVQVARNGTTDSALLGPGGLAGAIALAINDGICYWEVWNQDILNPDFEAMLTDAMCASTPTNVTNAIEQQTKLSIYPNPFAGVATIQLVGAPIDADYNLVVINTQGKMVKSVKGILNGTTVLDGAGLSSGMYFYLLIEQGQVISSGKLILE